MTVDLARYRHISFDLDGTLVHTIAAYRHRVTPRAVAALGGRTPTTEIVDQFWFEASRDRVIREEFGLDPTIFWKHFHTIDTPADRAAHTTAYPDAEPALRRLRVMGKIISILTGAPHYVAQLEIEKLNGAPYDFFLSLTDGGFPEKPNPKSFHVALEKLACTPAETLYIGNSNEDALYAKNVGADFIYLERKEHPFDLRSYAIATIHSLDQLCAAL